MNPRSKISLQKLALTLGLAKSTVSMALRDDPRVAPATREKVRQAARIHGYLPDADVATLMAHIQARKPPTYHANLAIVQIFRTRVAARELDGIRQRAAELGYKVDFFDDFARHANPVKMLQARGIQGVLFIGWPFREFPQDVQKFLPICEYFPTVVLNSKPEAPLLNSVTSDPFLTMHTACEELFALGYRRPVAFINQYLDSGQNGGFTGAFLSFQRRLERPHRLAPFYDLYKPDRALAHIRKVQPDCVITHDPDVITTLQSAGYSVPGDIGIAHLDLNADLRAAAMSGVDQNHDLLGQVAVDVVVAQIHRSESGIPKPRRCISVDGTWFAGKTTASAITRTKRPRAKA